MMIGSRRQATMSRRVIPTTLRNHLGGMTGFHHSPPQQQRLHVLYYLCPELASTTSRPSPLSFGHSSLQSQSRWYRATPRHEIVPVLAAVLGIAVIRYSYKALQRMDAEWEDYQWQLQQYEKNQQNKSTTASLLFPHGTLGIDLGTVHLSLAHCHSAKRPEVMVNREGDRYTFAGVLYNDDTENEILLGRMAFEKLYERQFDLEATQVIMPRNVLKQQAEESSNQIIRDAVESVVNHTLETIVESSSQDESSSHLDGVRPVVTIPPDTNDTRVNRVQEAFSTFLGNHITFVPEPVAAIWGAEALLDLDTSHGKPILVVDVGGYVTSVSVIQKNKVLAGVEIEHVGGEVWPQVIVQHIVNTSNDSLKLEKDGMAMQRLYQAAHLATMEYNTQTQAHISIPYISMDTNTREAQHLDMTISRSIVEQEVQEHLQETVKALLEEQQDDSSSIFSSHLPPPTNYTSLWTSVMAQLFEKVELTPMDLQQILLVGGGSKQAMIASSVEQSWLSLTGNVHNVLIPELSKRSELVALGAASLSPKYQYTPDKGLVKAETWNTSDVN